MIRGGDLINLVLF